MKLYTKDKKENYSINIQYLTTISKANSVFLIFFGLSYEIFEKKKMGK